MPAWSRARSADLEDLRATMMLGDANTSAPAAGNTAAVGVLVTAANLAVTVGVDRHRHPVIWWLFGPVPLALGVLGLVAGRAVSK
jgi:hypothetical protein